MIRQQAVELLFYQRVALAYAFFQSRAIKDFDVAAAVRNQSFRVQRRDKMVFLRAVGRGHRNQLAQKEGRWEVQASIRLTQEINACADSLHPMSHSEYWKSLPMAYEAETAPCF
jgi:hypothetical protein